MDIMFSMKRMIALCLLVSCFVNVWGINGRVFDGFRKEYLWKGVSSMRNETDSILYVPEKSVIQKTDYKKMAVVICPGGSYHHLGLPHEGFATARWFLSQNAVPFVLRYRVAANGNHHPAMLEDFQMSIKYIRENAEFFGIDPEKVGAIGFSAGGHLVTMGAVMGNDSQLEKLGVECNVSVSPDFVMPIYPVVSMMDPIAHKKSRKSLLGKSWNDEKMREKFSMELNIPLNMVPIYILACKDDPVVMFENSVRLEKSLSEKNIPHRFAVHEKGGHGFGMKDGWFMKETHWNENLREWLTDLGFLKN